MSSRRAEFQVVQKKGEYGKSEILAANSLSELREKIEAMEGGD